MQKQYDAIVYIGRFQPFHNAHLAMLQKAAKLADKVIVIVGSANQPRTTKNPFTSEERIDMIRAARNSVPLTAPKECFFEPIEDTIYNNTEWCVNVQEIVSKYTTVTEKVAIIGHKKDNSSDYLDMFPQWGFVDQPLIEPLHASQVRESYFSPDINLNWFLGVVPPSTIKFLDEFRNTPEFSKLVAEKDFLIKCKKPYIGLPYLPIFVTSDMCVFQNAHVLMGIRKSEPGRGLLAFPGGYVNAATDASCLDAAVREFYEETRAKIPEKVLRGSLVAEKVFDAVDRSERGRIITHAYKAQLPDGEMPKVRGSDDLASARWIPISEVRRDQCFEDHYDILKYFLGVGN